MADTYTSNYTFILVEVGASRDTWGSKENTNLISIDTNLKSLQDQLTSTTAAYKAWLPIGSITMWHTGSSGAVPAGWAICDGRTVARSDGGGDITTPNLVGRFIRAATTSGAIGGSDTMTVGTDAAGSHSHGSATGGTAITIAQMPSHTHSLNAYYQNSVTAGSGGGAAWRADAGAGNTGSAGSDQPHTHSIGADGSHTHNVTVSIVPSYFSLIYIMRV